MILSIESSCDDSSVAVTKIEDKSLLFHKKISQELEHNQYGGVVPELAARLHVKALPKIVDDAKEFFPYLKAIAVTNEPGLTLSLAEGVMVGKALSIALNIPLIPIHHLKGHVYSAFIEKEINFPFYALIASGGHTQIVSVKSYEDFHELGTTKDDSIGEAFDKVSKMLGLGYPGGAVVEKRALAGDENSYSFPIPLLQTKEIAFSYSGLKNSVRLEIEKRTINEREINNICASFQKSATGHIINKLERFFQKHKAKNLVFVGGVSANLYIREKLENLCSRYGCKLMYAKLDYTGDNAAMIGRASVDVYEKSNKKRWEDFTINSRSSFRRVD